MVPRLSGQTSIFGVVFFVFESLLGIERQKKLKKFTILTRKPRNHVRILIYRTWPIANCIVKPLMHIFNLSFLTGIIPNALKIARVTPVYKANNKENFSNYRPISVLPCFSKILEKLTYKRAITFLNKNNILSNNQYGFRAGHSTQQLVIELVDKTSQAIERKEYTVGLFLDLSKAFDTLNHHILLEKLQHYGSRGVALEWFKIISQIENKW